MIGDPDFSSVDRAVEKVIAKHECMARIEAIVREKIDEDFHPMIRAALMCSKMVRLAAEASKLKAIISKGNNLTQASKIV